jgi:hypothetical protein
MIIRDLSSVLILQCTGFQFHQDRALESVLEQKVESPNTGKGPLASDQYKLFLEEEVIGIRSDEVFHVLFGH